LKNQHLGEAKVQRPRVLGQTVELQQGRYTIVEYIDRAKLLLIQIEVLELKDSLPMLSHQFVRGLNEHLRLSCGPYLHEMLNDDKGLDEIAVELHNIASIVQNIEARVNTTYGRGTEHKLDHGKKEKRCCHQCGKRGHLKKDCWEFNGKPPSNSGIRGKSENAGKTENAGEGGTAKVSVAMMGSLDGSNTHDLWFDTGATLHIVCDRKLVHELQESHIESVVLGGGEKHPVLGQGKMIIEGGPSGTVNLNGALPVPSLKLTLCAGVQVTAKGAECWRGGEKIVIRKDNEVIIRGHKEGGMYRMSGKIVLSQGSLAVTQLSQESVELWHKRLGHTGKGAISDLTEVEAVSGLGNVGTDDGCDICVKAKQTREHFARSSSRALNVLELVHSDVIGPLRTRGMRNERYVVTLMDDYSRYSEVFCVGNKGVVARKLIEALVRWEKLGIR
jgi:hypothetical protein